jgi:hypothetical protein
MLKWFGFKDKSTSQQQQPQHSQQQPSSSISQDDIINDESSRIRAYSTPRVLVLQESDRQSGLLADTDARVSACQNHLIYKSHSHLS